MRIEAVIKMNDVFVRESWIGPLWKQAANGIQRE